MSVCVRVGFNPGALALYYNTYIYKEPCMDSYNTGMQWFNEILHGHWTCCVNMFRMDSTTFQSFCFQLGNQCHNPILGYSPKINFFFKIKIKIIIIKAGNVEKANRESSCNFGGNSKPNCTPLCQKMEEKNANSRSN
jgi:hypothetical protein